MPKPHVPDDINYSLLPTKRLRGAMRRYLELGYKPGDFLTACIENNFTEAVVRANGEHYLKLREIAWFLHSNGVPRSCWGSHKKRLAWQKLFEEGDTHVQPPEVD